MSLLILAFDTSSDQIGRHLQTLLNSSVSTNYPTIASFCPSSELFNHDHEKVFINALKRDSLSHNDLLGFLILIDIATSSKHHLQHLPIIDSLLRYLNRHHSFQAILTFIIHAHPTNQLYTSPFTSFNLNFIFSHLYSFVQGIVFQNIDHIDTYQTYHSDIAMQIGSIFRPVTSLREDAKRFNSSVVIEFLQFIQHLLPNPQQKILVMFHHNLKKAWKQSSYAALLIQRGEKAVPLEDTKLNNLDIWTSLEKGGQTILIVNSPQLNKTLLETLIIQPYRNKVKMNNAYFYWLKKKFDIENLEEKLQQGIQLCENIVNDK